MNTLFVIIPLSQANNRIDVALAYLLKEYSRSKITAWIKKGWVQFEDKALKPKDKVVGGEFLTIKIEQEATNKWQGEDIPLDIIYQDEDILIVNKPAGLVTHPGAGNGTGTLANALLFYDKNLEFVDRVGIVHRLDKETSGLLVVARNDKARQHLIAQLQEHTAYREYVAVVYGHMISGGTIDAPIGRDGRDRTKQAIKEGGKDATTNIRVIERFKSHTLVKAVLETGRTHQIRVHLSSTGYPLIGDFVYGGRVRFPKGADEVLKNTLKEFPRQALHARKLTLTHPVSQQKMSWKVPIPKDIKDLLQVLEIYDEF